MTSLNIQLLAQDASLNTTAPSSVHGWIVFAVVLAVILVPFLLGNLIARALKLKEFSTRIGLVLFSLALGLGPFVVQMIQGRSPLEAISLGIDLAGGTNMIFQVDKEKAEAIGKDITPQLMQQMEQAVGRRVNPTGTEEVVVRTVGADRLEVIVPGADQEKVSQTIRRIVDLGKLEFALLANEVDHASLIRQADALGPDVNEIRDSNGKLVAKWRRAAVDTDGNPKERPGDRVHYRTKMVNDKPVTEFLVVVDPDPAKQLDGELLRNVAETVTEQGLAVSFTFNERGGQLMRQLTLKNQPRPGAGYRSRLAVLLNEEIHSAPTINAVIEASGVIEGNFSQAEIDELLAVLNAGALQVPLISKPVSESTISPTLGADVTERGLRAMAIATVAVFVVTAGYYLIPGVIADICLALNIILIMGAMSLISATFTLPGLAGLVLSIGMAVDANVLIFERMREERARGSSLRMAIKNGFDKAWMTIFDSNVTTLITAVVLYYIGTDQVKGFAVTLFIGVLISMFTAVYVGRLIFDIAERKKWITDVKMMSVIKATNYDFLSAQGVAIAVSVLLIALGMGTLFLRGKDNLDIDFRGGSLVAFQFVGDQPSYEQVREALETKFDKSLTLERLTIGEPPNTEILFRMRTIEPDAQQVAGKILEAFADLPYKLEQQHLEIGDVKTLAGAAETSGSEAAATPDRFAGGHEVAIKLENPMTPSSFADTVAAALNLPKVSGSEESPVAGTAIPPDAVSANEMTLKFAANVPQEKISSALGAVKAELESRPHFQEVNTFDSSVATDTQIKAIMAIFLSLLAIVAYLWVRFQHVTFGLAACIALLHDVLIVLGLLAIGAYASNTPLKTFLMLDDFKINMTIVASFLTIIGYSLNDTIVVFDRIREVRGRNPMLTKQMVNQSLNETLSRTILTSMTTLVVLFILYAMGGEGIHGFCYCMLLGIIVGTFSSIYIACPVLLWLTHRTERRMSAAA